MSKCAAIIEIGWVKRCFEANSARGIIEEVEKIQDFDCLMMMGREEEDRKGQKELDKLEVFLRKYYNCSLTMEDIRNLEVHLSLGNIMCHGIAENKEEVERLKSTVAYAQLINRKQDG